MELSLLYCLVSGSALTDLYKSKIFNNWLLIGVIGAAALSIAGFSQEPMTTKLLRAAATLIFLIPVYAMGGLGAGDVKLFSVIALFLSWHELLMVMIISFVIGAVIGLLKVAASRNIKDTIHFALPMLISVILVTNTNVLFIF